MKNISPELLADIKKGSVIFLIKISLKDGTDFGYSSYDVPVYDGLGTQFNPAPALQRIRMMLSSNAEVSSQEFASTWVDIPEDDLLSGKMDDAEIEVSLASWNMLSNSIFSESVIIYKGQLALIRWSEDGFVAEINSYMKRFEKAFGVTFTPSCRHELYGAAKPGGIGFCGLDRNSFKTNGAIASIEVSKWRFGIDIVQADHYYDVAILTFLTGNNAGLSFEVKNHWENKVELFLPTAFVVQVGDTFEITAGCDKQFSTCKNKFNNQVNFGGFPHIVPEVQFR